MSRKTCRGTKDDGTPCGSPVVKGDGYCPAHGPDGREKMSEIGRKGAAATARKYASVGLEDDELPPLDGPRAAERWCEVIARAVATGRLGHNEGRTVARLISEWRQSHDAGEVTDRLDRLMDALAEWRRTGDPEPVLELVEGGRDA